MMLVVRHLAASTTGGMPYYNGEWKDEKSESVSMGMDAAEWIIF
jgi:hypothetical protein